MRVRDDMKNRLDLLVFQNCCHVNTSCSSKNFVKFLYYIKETVYKYKGSRIFNRDFFSPETFETPHIAEVNLKEIGYE